MSGYKFDGTYLRGPNGNKLAEVKNESIRDAHMSEVGKIKGAQIRDKHLTLVAEFDGENIRDAHLTKIGTIKEVRKVIDGPGGITLVALWLFFVR